MHKKVHKSFYAEMIRKRFHFNHFIQLLEVSAKNFSGNWKTQRNWQKKFLELIHQNCLTFVVKYFGKYWQNVFPGVARSSVYIFFHNDFQTLSQLWQKFCKQKVFADVSNSYFHIQQKVYRSRSQVAKVIMISELCKMLVIIKSGLSIGPDKSGGGLLGLSLKIWQITWVF